MQKSVRVRNAQLDALEATIGASPSLKLRSGAAPASCGTADSGVVVATLPLPADWMAAASGGAKALLGTWEDTAADNANAGGTMHWRIYAADSACDLQGTVSVSGGAGEVQVDNLNIAQGQKVAVSAFNVTAGGA